jgi:hypothetical protein
MRLSDLDDQLLLRGRCQRTTLIQQIEDTKRVLIDEVDDGLVVVVLKLLQVLLQPLLSEFLLFALKDVRDVELLQLLVGEVDAQLLEGVHLEVLETENVKKTYRKRLRDLNRYYDGTSSMSDGMIVWFSFLTSQLKSLS